MEFVFFILAIIAVIATLAVITSSRPIYALLYLVVSLLSYSGIFFCLGAYFAAALEIVVYAGAIMVLFVFVVMMLNLGNAVSEQERAWLQPKVWIGPSFLSLIMFVVIAQALYSLNNNPNALIEFSMVDAKVVGISLFGPYLLLVELASMLLLAGIVVAYHLGRENKDAQRDIDSQMKIEEGVK